MIRWKILAAAALVSMLACGCASRMNPVLIADKPLHQASVIVVLGFGPPVDKDGKPVDELVRRVTKGVELYKAGMAPKMIMTGGNTYKDYYESEEMKKLAVKMGVPDGDVLEERKAMDTIGNARYSAAIMRENGWNDCILVSTPYHLKRAKKLFEAAGLTVQTAGCEVPDSPWYGVKLTIYESWVALDYAFIDEDALVRGEKGDKHTDRIRGPVRARTETVPEP